MNYPKIFTLEPQLFEGQMIKASSVSLKMQDQKTWSDKYKMYMHGTIYGFRVVGTDDFLYFEFNSSNKFITKAK